ncbi:MAG: DUF4296 domain-containing protein [Paludibacteraceae bacterium]|nr:DUF4296 domain-containing protein [Paludibacteraceae bacterium]
MKHSSLLLLTLLLLLLSTGCSQRPARVLDEESFAALLTDIFQLEGMQRFGYLPDSVRMEDYYHTIFVEHGITRAQLDSTVAWYLQHPDDYRRICDSVIVRMERHSDSLQQVIREADAPVTVRDGGTRKRSQR